MNQDWGQRRGQRGLSRGPRGQQGPGSLGFVTGALGFEPWKGSEQGRSVRRSVFPFIHSIHLKKFFSHRVDVFIFLLLLFWHVGS